MRTEPLTGPAGSTVGDLTLVLGPDAEQVGHLIAPSGEQTALSEADGARLLATDRGPDWTGFPLWRAVHGPWSFWMLGETYGAPPDPERFARVCAGGAGESLNGHFLVVAHDRRDDEWHVLTDRFGTVHAYLWQGRAHTVVSTRFRNASVPGDRTLDWRGLTGFLRDGFFPGDRTPYREVRILPPASHATLAGPAAPQTRRYWEWSHEPDTGRSYDDTVDAFAEAFSTVVGEWPRQGRTAIPISGGLDSRSAVAAWLDADSTRAGGGWAYSYGYGPDSVETRIAREVAAAAGLPFESHVVTPYLLDGVRSVVGAVEGFQDLTQCRQAIVAEPLRRAADFVVAAHWGDVWLDTSGWSGPDSPTARTLSDALRAKTRKAGSEWLLEHVVAGHVDVDDELSALAAASEGEFERLGHIEDPDFRLKAAKTDTWSFRWTLASLRMYQAGAFPRLPFYDTRMTDFLGTVPTEYLEGRRLQLDYLRRHAPDLARVEWQGYGTDLFRVRFHGSLLLPRRAIGKLMRRLKGDAIPTRNWEVQFGSERARARLRAFLTAPGGPLSDLVEPGTVASLLDRFATAPDRKVGYTVSMLFTLAATLEDLRREPGGAP